jgi:hypothetical protein
MPKSDSPNEDEVKKAAEMREWLEEKIAEVENELVRLKDMQTIVDSVLRRNSFVPATELRAYNAPSTKNQSPEQSGADVKSEMQTPVPKSSTEESKELRRPKDGKLIATAFISPEKIVVVPSADVRVSQTIPPFQNFFINRIVKGYESKDVELVSSGKLESHQALKFGVEESDGNIVKVTIENYREKARLNEILNTINWAFTKMLEKK